jgi:hypothetical protein
MTKARDISSLIGSSGQIDNTKITLDVNEIPSLTTDKIPNLDAGKITTGTFADARISNSSVSQHATSFDDNKIVNDISTLALRQASDENKSAYNTNSSSVDVFQDSTGIDTTSSVIRNSNEYMLSGTQGYGSEKILFDASGYTVSQISSGSANTNLVNIKNWTIQAQDATSHYNPDNSSQIENWYGVLGNAANNGAEWIGGYVGAIQGQGSESSITMDSGSAPTNTSPIFTRISGDATWNNSGTVYLEGSNDASSFSTIGSQTNNGSSSAFDTGTNGSFSTAYRYYRLRIVFGSNYDWGFRKTKFYGKTYDTITSATGNFTGTTITAPSSVSSMGAIITYQDQAGTNALNTDIVLQLSADGGSNYSTATLTALPDFATGIKMAKVNDLSVTAGTQLKYKISFANQASGSKEARIRGVALQY